MLVFGMIVQMLWELLFLTTNNLMVTYILIFVNGYAIAPNTSISYLYMMEVVEEKKRKLFNYFAQTLDAIYIISIAIFYLYVKEINWILWWFLIIHILLNLLAISFIPESPNFLYSKCRFSELKDCFNNYAKLNNAPQLHPHAKFNKEASDVKNVVEDSSIGALVTDRSRFKNLVLTVFNWWAWGFWFYFFLDTF